MPASSDETMMMPTMIPRCSPSGISVRQWFRRSKTLARWAAKVQIKMTFPISAGWMPMEPKRSQLWLPPSE